MATILNKLMIETLEYKNYLAQGGDWGATIANWIAYDHSKSCKAIHINCLTMRHADGPQSKQEEEWQQRFDKDQVMQDGYRTQQATKPQTLSYGMMDSPVGIAAWIIEKMYSWSDLKDNNIESVYSKDTLLANIMVYVVTKTFNTASWIYYGRREEGGRFFPKDFKKIKVPTAIAILFAFSLFILMPLINKLKDNKEEQKFKYSHTLSVIINFIQIIGLIYLIFRFEN